MSMLGDLRLALAKLLLGERGLGLFALEEGSVKAVDENPLRRVQLARVYWERRQVVALTKRQQEWVSRHANGIGVRYVVNVARKVVEAYKARLHLENVGVSGASEGENQAAEALLARHAIPKSVQQEMWDVALVDGVAFLYTDYRPALESGDLGQTIYKVERLLVPEEVGGDGEGIVPIYGDDMSAYPSAFARIWREEIPDPRVQGGGMVTALFKTEYRDGWVERYWRLPSDDDWKPYPDEDAYITPWVWYPNGEPEVPPPDANMLSEPVETIPLPPPISMWALPELVGILDDVVPIQAMLDKVWVNLMMVSDWLGHGLIVFTGWIPTSNGLPLAKDRSNLLTPTPGDYVWTLRQPGEASTSVHFPSTANELLALESRLIARLSAISGVPQSAFVDTRAVASEGTLKQQESEMLARIDGIHAAFSSGVEHWARGLLAQIVAFGGGEDTALQGWSGFKFYPVWRNPATRSEKDDVDIAVKKVQELGFDLRPVWKSLGLTDDQIEVLEQSPFARALIAEAEARVAMAEAQKEMGAG